MEKHLGMACFKRQWCGQRSKVFLASKDTSERSMGPRDCGALKGVLGTRKRVKTRSGEPREQRLGSYPID